MEDDKITSEAMDDARKALYNAALKAAQYLDTVFTSIDAENHSRESSLSHEAGNDYGLFMQERADIALRLLEIAFSPRK